VGVIRFVFSHYSAYLIRDNDGLESLLENAHSSVVKSRAKIQDFLNYYESICIGFDKGILDESFYRDYWSSTFVQHWNDAESLIRKVQVKSPKAYIRRERYKGDEEYKKSGAIFSLSEKEKKLMQYIAQSTEQENRDLAIKNIKHILSFIKI
jgi:hypothetical protein